MTFKKGTREMNNEPVAWMFEKDGAYMCIKHDNKVNYDGGIPLYTHPANTITFNILGEPVLNLDKAEELASWLETGEVEEIDLKESATMLRHQQADYYSLLVNHDKLYAKVVEQQAEIEALKKHNEELQKACVETLVWVMGNG